MLPFSVLFPKEVTLKSSQVDLTTATAKGKTSERRHKLPSSTPLDSGKNCAQQYVPNINHAVQDAISFYNPRLNDRQKAAVIQIVLGQGRPLPYVIFGPPGELLCTLPMSFFSKFHPSRNCFFPATELCCWKSKLFKLWRRFLHLDNRAANEF